MTIREFLGQVARIAGDKDGNALSEELLLEYLTEEMRYCAAVFPSKHTITDDSGEDYLTAAGLSNITPLYAWSDNHPCEKTYASQMLRYLEVGGPSGTIYWSQVGGAIAVYPSGGSIRVMGELLPPQYGVEHLDLEMANRVDVTDTEVPSLVGVPLMIVRYRMIQRACEELGDYNRAQYFLSVADKREREALRTWKPDNTDSLGIMVGVDF